LNEPGFTPDHPCLKDYNEIIQFKNIEISILKYLEKTNLPYPFHHFYPTIVNKFIENYKIIYDKIKDKPTRNANLTIYNNMSCHMDYKHLSQLLELNYNDLKN
jgi:hypothetical protein